MAMAVYIEGGGARPPLGWFTAAVLAGLAFAVSLFIGIRAEDARLEEQTALWRAEGYMIK